MPFLAALGPILGAVGSGIASAAPTIGAIAGPAAGLVGGLVGAGQAEQARKNNAAEIMNAAGGPVKPITQGTGNPAATMGLTSSPFAGAMNPVKAPTAPKPMIQGGNAPGGIAGPGAVAAAKQQARVK